MKKILSLFYLSIVDLLFLLLSAVATVLAFLFSKNTSALYLISSLVGVVSLVYTARGNVIGQILIVVFSVLYGVISFSYRYFGEMITYLGMTAPIAIASVISWIKHPFRKKKDEVEVNRLSAKEYLLILAGGILVGFGFYFLLRAFHTENLILSSVSVVTSFIAAWLTMRRSPFYAVAYAANDAVLIALWVLATLQNGEYACMVVCFCVFFLLDSYGFFRWLAMQKRQSKEE